MIRAILAILVALNWVDTSSSTYVLLNMVADTAFYFLPVFLAYSSAKDPAMPWIVRAPQS